MSPSLPYGYQDSASDCRILVTFSSSLSAQAQPICSIDSRSGEYITKKKALVLPSRAVGVQFENCQDGNLIIREEVHDKMRPGHGAVGKIVVPQSKFDNPSFQISAANIMKVTMPLRADFVLGPHRFRTAVEGDWSEGCTGRLQSYYVRRKEKEGPKIRAIIVTFFNAARYNWRKPDSVMAVPQRSHNEPGISSQSPHEKASMATSENSTVDNENIEQAKGKGPGAATEATKVAEEDQATEGIVTPLPAASETTQDKLMVAETKKSSLFQDLSMGQQKDQPAQDESRASADTAIILRRQVTVGGDIGEGQDHVNISRNELSMLLEIISLQSENQRLNTMIGEQQARLEAYAQENGRLKQQLEPATKTAEDPTVNQNLVDLLCFD